jgi:hypothetical protein
MLIGRTVITLSAEQLHFANRLGAMVEFQKRSFSTHEISRLRVEPRQKTRKGGNFTVYVLVFDYGDEVAELEVWLTRTEADSLSNGPLKHLTVALTGDAARKSHGAAS